MVVQGPRLRLRYARPDDARALFELGRDAALLQSTVDRAFDDADLLRKVVADYADCSPKFTQGRAFEFLHPLKFNVAAGLADSPLRAVATQAVDAHAPADILIQDGPAHVVEQVQAKSYSDPYLASRHLMHAKYEGMQRLVPSDKVDAVARHLDANTAGDAAMRADAREHLTDRLRYDGVESGGVSTAEARFAVDHPHLATLQEVGSLALKEIGQVAAARAVAGGGLALGFNGALNVIDVARANGVLEAALSTRRFVNGEIDAASYREELAYTAVCGSAAFYCGMAGNLILPGVGGFVGAVVGYTTASILVQAGVLGSGARSELEAARERQRVVEAETAKAIRAMAELSRSIDAVAAAYALEETQWRNSFAAVELALTDWQVGAALTALADLNRHFHAALPFRSLSEFDELMLDEDALLPL
jgi:hypothetical protein